jgi:hypothetical protein
MDLRRIFRVICVAAALSQCLTGQDLTPRAYIIMPTGSTAVIFSFGYNTSAILLDPTSPITDLSAQFQTPVLSVYRSFGFFSRSADVTVSAPYGYGHFQGAVLGTDTRISRSGLANTRVRFSVNLHGGPAMDLPKFVKYRERTIIGAHRRKH